MAHSESRDCRQVLYCASLWPLWRERKIKSARGLAQSKTLRVR